MRWNESGRRRCLAIASLLLLPMGRATAQNHAAGHVIPAYPTVTALTGPQRPAIAGLDAYQGFGYQYGWFFTQDTMQVDSMIGELRDGAMAFEHLFGQHLDRGAVVILSLASAQNMGSNGVVFTLPPGADSALTKAGAAWTFQFLSNSTFAQLLGHPGAKVQETNEGMLRHEIGHVWFELTYGIVNDSFHTAGVRNIPVPAWLAECAAILIENLQLQHQRMHALVTAYRANPQDRRIVPLDTLFAMLHPDADTVPATINGVARKTVLFYEECRGVINFLLEHSRKDRPIFGSIADGSRRGETMGQWLQAHGAHYGLPATVRELDTVWQQWLKQQVIQHARSERSVAGAVWAHPYGAMQVSLRTSWCDSSVVMDTLPTGPHAVTVVACSFTAADSAALRRTLQTVARTLTLYGHLTGLPYAAPRYVMQFEPSLDASGETGGYTEGTGRTFFRTPLPDPRLAGDRPAMMAKILVHELAHQWPGAGGVDSSAAHLDWLAEGFADFLAGQTWRAAGDRRAEEEFLFFYNVPWDDAFLTDPALNLPHFLGNYSSDGWYSIPWPGATVWTTPLDPQGGYYRGAVVLWMLEQELGEARFWAVIHRVLTTRAPGVGMTEALRQAIQVVTGENLDWFLREWVTGTGYPRVTVAATYDVRAHQVTLTVHQPAPVFRMPVTIRVGTARGDVLTHTVMDGPTQTIVIPRVTRAPTFVVFDDADAVVKTLEFPQPTAWLVAQLAREGGPWQTWWAIEQLRHRARTEPRAAMALVRATRMGHYALTRAQAAVALDSAGTPAAESALLAALRDSAVLVRRAALQGLRGEWTPAALAVVRTLIDRDASDLVRAEAIQSFLTAQATPGAERLALFDTALRWPPTYLNVVQTAAVKGMALHGCDSAAVAVFRAASTTPGMEAVLQQATTTLTKEWPAAADPTCLGTFAAQLPPP